MKKIAAFIATAIICSSTVHADTFDPTKLPVAKQTISGKYLSAKEAFELDTQNGGKPFFVDVRTQAETEYVGLADQVDLNIPYWQDNYGAWDMEHNRFFMSPNCKFITKVDEAMKARGLAQSDVIICICRSGDRSSKAATDLTKAGYTNVYTVYDGFEGDMGKEGASKGRRTVNGWKNAGLPWGYSLNKERAYFGN